jgi:hypothetical protein
MAESEEYGVIKLKARKSGATTQAFKQAGKHTGMHDHGGDAPPSPSAASMLIAAAPLTALRDLLRARVEAGRSLGSESTEQRQYERFAILLANALDEARRADIWVEAAHLSESLRIPAATLSRWCRQHGDGVWARREARIWVIHFPSYIAWHKTQHSSRRAA